MVRKYLRATGHFAHWLECEGIPRSSLSEDSLRVFTGVHFERCHCAVPTGESLVHTRAAVGHLLGLLRRRGEIPQQEAPQTEPVEAVLETFEAYVQGICGATPGTSRLYSRQIRSFLRARYGDGLIDLTQLVPSDLVLYVSEYAARVERATAKTATTALRSFLRCLRLRGGPWGATLIFDTFLYLPEDGIVFSGDLVMHGMHPILWEGAIKDWLSTLRRMQGLPIERLVPGHGPVGDASFIATMIRYIELVNKAAEAVREGGSAGEVASKPLPEPFGRWFYPSLFAANVERFPYPQVQR